MLTQKSRRITISDATEINALTREGKSVKFNAKAQRCKDAKKNRKGGSAKMRQDQKPRVIQMNDDSVAFYRYCTTERPTVKALEDMVDIFARANIDTLTQCVHCRWQAYYDSSVVEVAGDLTPEAVRP